jgi:hypothetical protein
VARLKSLGARVATYGWQPAGLMRALIEGSGVDGFLPAPVMPQGFNHADIVALLGRMQALKSGRPVGTPGNTTPNPINGMAGGLSPRTSVVPPPAMVSPRGSLTPAPNGMQVGNNPLYAPSPMTSQLGQVAGSTPAPQAEEASADAEAQLMVQLMQEINQLRQELNS